MATQVGDNKTMEQYLNIVPSHISVSSDERMFNYIYQEANKRNYLELSKALRNWKSYLNVTIPHDENMHIVYH